MLTIPPGSGIVHQVNLEYLARVVFNKNGLFYPDSVLGTDSHTTMINGLGVLGWGVGGIDAEAAMLGQPMSMVLPGVVGFNLHGTLRNGVTATDLVLTVTQMLRKHGVGKFVEFYEVWKSLHWLIEQRLQIWHRSMEQLLDSFQLTISPWSILK